MLRATGVRAPSPANKTEFEPRIAGLKQRMSQLQERHQAARVAVETERELALVSPKLLCPAIHGHRYH